jgi:hypothetical protein
MKSIKRHQLTVLSIYAIKNTGKNKVKLYHGVLRVGI